MTAKVEVGLGGQRSLVCLVLAAVTAAALASEPKAPASEPPHWDYGSEHGPASWSKLDPAWVVCSAGRSQSPIDIPSKAPAASPEADKSGAADVAIAHSHHLADVLNNGHTIQVNYGGADTLVLGDTAYSLVQYHFHGPSEHTVDGKHFPMEMHLVHKSADGKLAVIAVLMKEGAENDALAPVWAKLPKSKGDDRVLGELTVDVDELLPRKRKAYRYDGSLTTPPCSEGVKWFVMQTPIQLSTAQVKAFQGIIHVNNRPTQPLNGRKVSTVPLTLK